MLTVPASTRVYLAAEPVDMRKGFDGLCAIVAETWKKDPFSGHLFVFVGKRKDRIKVLFWDHGGFALYYKRLEKGRFQMPDTSGKNVRLEPTQLAMLLSGIDLNRPRLRRWQPPETAIDKTLST
jgi:transposase